MNTFPKTGAAWIWLEQERDEINQYVEFWHEFTLDELYERDAKLYISVDSDYAVWVNGILVGFGQYSDFPHYKVYDVLAAGDALKPGKNVLCVLAYYQGVSSSEYIKGEPGLIYALKAGCTDVVSGGETFCRKSAAYKTGIIDRISQQLGFTFEYDARSCDDWLEAGYTKNNIWKRAQINATCKQINGGDFVERPIKKLSLKQRVNADIISQGLFTRAADEKKRLSQLIHTDFLSARDKREVFGTNAANTLPADGKAGILASAIKGVSGAYMILDLGREEAGFFEMELEADAGTVIDIAYGEHLEDMRVRAEVGKRNFANRYICKEGYQTFTHYFTRFGGRYIELHVSSVKNKFNLHYAGLRPTEYPVERRGAFYCSDLLNNRIYDVAVRTLHLCMHEHYEDCPWREQALYSMDSRNQALSGYYCFGEYDFPQASFALLGKGLREDGYLELCAPAEVPITIPAFSMVWIVELAEHYLYSGRIEPVKEAMPKIKKMLDEYAACLQDGLYPTPSGKQYWNFYEWADGLDGTEVFRQGYVGLKEIRFDAPLNSFLVMALVSAAGLAKVCGDAYASDRYSTLAKHIKESFHEKFWDGEKQVYKTYYGEGCPENFNELTQALAVCAGVCDEYISSVLRRKLASKECGLVETTLSHSFYKFEALMGEPDKYTDFVFEKISRDWGYMLYKDATSFWETIKGAGDFDNAGSLCHGWSSIPVYFYHAYILGVKPVEPGFKTFKAKPVNSVFDRAAGKIPTPYGDICIEMEKTGGKPQASVSYSAGMERIFTD